MRPRFVTSFTALAVVLASGFTHASRPLVTDDARVVGRSNVQLETWIRRDTTGFAHWALAAYGPLDRLEVSMGAVWGRSNDPEPAHFDASGPLLEGKFLFYEARPNQMPGVALVAGVFSPFGHLETPGWSGFVYSAFTQSLLSDGALLVHLNLGLQITRGAETPFSSVWGVGAQLRTFGSLHAVWEIFSGDPYAHGVDGAMQGGARYLFSDHVQIDATVGKGLWGSPPLPWWETLGLRLVSG